MVLCAACERSEGTLRCTGCRPGAVYCSKACQTADWPLNHIFVCYAYRKKKVPSANHLALACHYDLHPSDPQTLEDYGFNRTRTSVEQTMLYGLYQGLFKYLKINPNTVHTWKRKGILIQEIKRVYEEFPSQDKGLYYPWFLERQDLLKPTLEPSEENLEIMVMRAWRQIDGRSLATFDEINKERETWPEYKEDCFCLYMLMLADSRPHPSLRMWLRFGFCAARNAYDEMDLSSLYRTLIRACSFEEFYRAYDSSSLRQLFRSKNINVEQFGSGLADVLGSAPHINKSVWDLKQFVVEDESGCPPVPSAAVDYGFFNCLNEEEKSQLKKIYKQFFREGNGDPLKLHQACLQGKTYDYVKTILKLENEDQGPLFRRLMWNPYPLPPEI